MSEKCQVNQLIQKFNSLAVSASTLPTEPNLYTDDGELTDTDRVVTLPSTASSVTFTDGTNTRLSIGPDFQAAADNVGFFDAAPAPKPAYPVTTILAPSEAATLLSDNLETLGLLDDSAATISSSYWVSKGEASTSPVPSGAIIPFSGTITDVFDTVGSFTSASVGTVTVSPGTPQANYRVTISGNIELPAGAEEAVTVDLRVNGSDLLGAKWMSSVISPGTVPAQATFKVTGITPLNAGSSVNALLTSFSGDPVPVSSLRIELLRLR